MQAKARQVSAQSQRCEVRILHPDDTQQAHEPIWIRGRRLLRPRKLQAHKFYMSPPGAISDVAFCYSQSLLRDAVLTMWQD